MPDAYTFGFSNRALEETVKILQTFGIQRVLDVRTLPGSRHTPQYNLESLEIELPKVGIEYIHLKDLGGLRKPSPDSVNIGWRNLSFRGYADYMQTEAFEQALAHAIELMKEKLSAFTCTEAVPWRCHRSLIADALVLRGYTIADIIDQAHERPHRMTPFLEWDGRHLTYPTGGEGKQGPL